MATEDCNSEGRIYQFPRGKFWQFFTSQAPHSTTSLATCTESSFSNPIDSSLGIEARHVHIICMTYSEFEWYLHVSTNHRNWSGSGAWEPHSSHRKPQTDMLNQFQDISDMSSQFLATTRRSLQDISDISRAVDPCLRSHPRTFYATQDRSEKPYQDPYADILTQL